MSNMARVSFIFTVLEARVCYRSTLYTMCLKLENNNDGRLTRGSKHQNWQTRLVIVMKNV